MTKLAYRGGAVAMPLLIALVQCTNATPEAEHKFSRGNEQGRSHTPAEKEPPPIAVGAGWLEYSNAKGGFAIMHPSNVKATTKGDGVMFIGNMEPGVLLLGGKAISPESSRRYREKVPTFRKFIDFVRAKKNGPFSLANTPFVRTYYGSSTQLTKRRNLVLSGINAVEILSFTPAACKGPIPLPGGMHADCNPFPSDGVSVLFVAKDALWILSGHTPNPGGTKRRLPLFDAMVNTFRLIGPEADFTESKTAGRLVQFTRGPRKRQLRRLISRSHFVALAKIHTYGRIAPPGLPPESERQMAYFQIQKRYLLKGKRPVDTQRDVHIVKAEVEPEIGKALRDHFAGETLVLFLKKPSRKKRHSDTPLYRLVDRLHGVTLVRSIDQADLRSVLPEEK